jgi:carbon-monoxide dehydrogenase large subunit
MLWGAVLGSPMAHARILSVDVQAAKALDGVRAVITGFDLPDRLVGTYVKDQPVLARTKVRYVGDPIAAVAAVDCATARAALRLIDVQYEELPPVFDPIEALKTTAPVIHEDRARYIALYPMPEQANAVSMTSLQEGDPDAAWSSCDEVVEGEFQLPSQQHMYLEPVASLADVDANGKITIWSSMQGVARVQALVAEALDIPMSKIRVIAPRVGGGFGGKCELTNQAVAAALALATRRPVKMTLSRDEDMTTMKRRHGGIIRMKTGARRDGTLVARTAEIYLEGGAYAEESPGVAAFCAYMSRGPYRIPHARVRAWGIYTNRSRASAFRGFGNPRLMSSPSV